MKNEYDIIKEPILTEKSYSALSGKRYTFSVDVNATKPEIKAAVEKIFKVKVRKVNTMRIEGKEIRQGRNSGKRAEVKKAIVTLTSDSKTIEFFDSLAQ